MSSVTDHLEQIDSHVKEAMRAVEEDAGASPVLHAVVKEFSRKSNKTLQGLTDPENHDIWSNIVELEQAGDSAKIAAEADKGVHADTRRRVNDAHDAICGLKLEMIDLGRRS